MSFGATTNVHRPCQCEDTVLCSQRKPDCCSTDC